MREKKVRASVYLSEHLTQIAVKTMGSKSKFVAEACRYYINNGGLEKWAKENEKNEADGAKGIVRNPKR